jgi:hypothetical protein
MVLASAVLAFVIASQAPQVPASPAVGAAQAGVQGSAVETPGGASTRGLDGGAEIVCRNEAVTGRRVQTRVCRSRAQMQAEAAAGRDALRRAQENHRRSQSE